MRDTHLDMGVGNTLDCLQPAESVSGPVDEIEVPAASNGASTAFYDVSTTVAFADEAPEQGRRRR